MRRSAVRFRSPAPFWGNNLSRTIVLIVLVGAVAALAVTSVRIVGRDEVRLVGKGAEARALRSGFNLVRPFAEVRRYRLSTRYDFSGANRLALPLKRGKRATIDCTIEARLDRDKVKTLDRDYEGRFAEKLVRPLVLRDLGTAFSAVRDPEELALDPTASGIKAGLDAALRPLGIEITAVSLKDLKVESGLPPGLERTEGLKVFILGFDGLDWKIVDLVSQTRELPNIQRVRHKGSWGNLRSIEPLVSPLVWTTIATGVTPDIHGITDFLVTDQATGEEIPATSTMRRVPALWNLASLFGLRSGLVGWLATYPAEDIEGFVVSDRVAYHMFDPRWHTGKGEVQGEAQAETGTGGLTYPPELLREIQPLLVTPEAVNREIAAYIHGPVGSPRHEFDPTDPVTNLRLIISGYRTYDGIVRKLYPALRPDLAAVYFEFTDSVCHLLMRYMRPPMPGVTREEGERYADGVAAAYLEADRILGEILSMLDDRTILMVLSDHGIKSGDMRPISDSRIGIGQAVEWHRLDGVIALYGPGVKPGHEIVNASVLDVAPTVLYLLGLPVDKRMPGAVLTEPLDQSWVRAHPVRSTDRYDSLFVMTAVSAGTSPADQALKAKLESLGYVAGGNASLVNMANFYHRNGRYAEAIAAWEKLVEADPNDLGARIGLSNAYFEIGKQDSAVAGLMAVLRIDPRNTEALRSLATIYVRRGMGEDALRVAEDALAADPRDGYSYFNRGLALELLGRREEAAEQYREAVRLAPDLAEAYANLAQIYLDKGAGADALAAARKAVDLASGKPEMHYVLGQTLELARQPEEALQHYMTAIKLDPKFGAAYIGASSVLLAEGKPDSVVALCAQALAVTSQYTQYIRNIKGMAHMAGRDPKAAAKEFQEAVRIDPTFSPARTNLARVYIEQGKRGDARRELETVLGSNPGDREARALLEGLR